MGARHLLILGGLVLLLLGASFQLAEAHRPQRPSDAAEVVRLSLHPTGSFAQVADARESSIETALTSRTRSQADSKAARADGPPDVQDDTGQEEASETSAPAIRTVNSRLDTIEQRMGKVEEEVEEEEKHEPAAASNQTAGGGLDKDDDESEENEMSPEKKEKSAGRVEENKAIQHTAASKHLGLHHFRAVGDKITSFFDIVNWTDDEVRMVATTTAILLMFFVAFLMVLVYMLNFPDEQVQSLSYKLVSTCIAILCAVLIEKAQFGKFSNLVVIAVILGEEMHDVKDELELLVINLVFYLFWFMFLSVMMKRAIPKHENFYAIRLFVAHEIAFVGIHMFAGPQQRLGQSNFARGWTVWPVILVQCAFVAGVGIFCGVISSVAHRARRTQASHGDEHHGESPQHGEGPQHDEDEHHGESPQHGEGPQHDEGHSNEDAQREGEEHQDGAPAAAEQDGQLAEHDAHHEGGAHHGDDHHHVYSELWKVEASEGEDEAAAILLSFLTRQVLLLVITGRVPTPKGDFGVHTSEEFGALFSIIFIVLVILLLVTKFLEAKMPKPHDHHVPTAIERTSEFVVQYFAFLVGWLSLSLCRWMMQRIVREKTLMFIGVAAWVSFPLILLIILVDFLCDEGWLKDSTALVFIELSGLVIGISWEKAFAMAIDTINHAHSGSTPAYVVTEIGLCVGLCLLLMPGWRWFICPTACQPVPKRKSQEDLAAEKVRAARSFVSKGKGAHSESGSEGSGHDAGPGAEGGDAPSTSGAEPSPPAPRQAPEARRGSAGGDATSTSGAEPSPPAPRQLPEARRGSAGGAAPSTSGAEPSPPAPRQLPEARRGSAGPAAAAESTGQEASAAASSQQEK